MKYIICRLVLDKIKLYEKGEVLMKHKWSQMVILGVMAGAVVMSVGCKKETPDSLLKAALKKQSEAKSFEGSMDMDMTMGMAQSGVSMELDMNFQMDIQMTQDPDMYHLKGSMGMDFMGLNVDMEMYGQENEESDTFTVYSMTDGSWQKYEEEQDEDVAEILANLDSFSAENLELEKDLVKVNGKKAYKMTGTMEGEELAESGILEAAGEEIQDLDWSNVKAKISIWIYKDSKLPAAMQIQVKDSPQSEDGAVAYLKNLNLKMEYKGYDNIDKIKIPKEALNAVEVSPDSEDAWTDDLDLEEEVLEEEELDEDTENTELRTDENGNYILTDYEGKKEVVVKPVEPFQILNFCSNDSLMFEYLPDSDSTGEKASGVTIIYALQEMNEYTTEEDVLAPITGDKDIYETTEGFSDVVYKEPVEFAVGDKTGKYASLRCRSGEDYLNEYTAWYLTEDGFAVSFVVLETRSGDENYMVTEDTLRQLLEAVEG